MTPEALVRLAEMDGSMCYELDLHAAYLQIDPTRHIEEAIRDARKMGKEVVKIIHGRGTGALQQTTRRTLERLKRNGTINYMRASDRYEELGAVMYVVVSS